MSQINLAPETDIMNTLGNAQLLLVEAAKQLVATKSLLANEPITQWPENKKRLERIREAEATIDTAHDVLDKVLNELLADDADEPIGEGTCDRCGGENVELYATTGVSERSPSDYMELCRHCLEGGAL